MDYVSLLRLFNQGGSYTKRTILEILGSELTLKNQTLYLEAKSQFLFLRSQQDKSQLTPPNDERGEPKKDKSKNNKVGPMIRPLDQPNLQFLAFKSSLVSRTLDLTPKKW